MAIRRGRPTWSSETTEREKMGHILSRTAKNPRALNQTGYLAGKYATAQDMMQTLTKSLQRPLQEGKGACHVPQPPHGRARALHSGPKSGA
jgi:hypothetical protein